MYSSFSRYFLLPSMRCLLAVVMMVGSIPHSGAQSIDPHNFVIENVYIATADAEEVPINLLVQDNKLKLLSKDDIPIPDGVDVLDANGGFLVGNLALGEPPQFMILDTDPRVDFEVLLEVDTRAVFALTGGEVRYNRLQYAEDMFEPRPAPKAWHAYEPPPVALPTNYGYTGSWNHWKTKNTTGIFFGIMALDRQFWMSQNDDSEQQVGSLEPYDGGQIRDLRLGIFGTFDNFERPWGYYVAVASNSFNKAFEQEGLQNFNFVDYRLDIPIRPGVRLSVGKQKEPISMERLMSLINLPMQERSSLTSSLLDARSFGLLLSGNASGDRISLAGGVFNKFIDTNQSIGEAETSVVGRVTWVPFLAEDKRNLLHLGASARLSNGKDGYAFFSGPEFNKAPLFVDTNLNDADSIQNYGFEVSWLTGPIWVAAEYVTTNVDTPAADNLDFDGYQITGSWILTGEMRDYRFKGGTLGPVPVSRSVNQNSIGAVEIAARWSSVDLSDGAIDGGQMNILSAGVSWWLTTTFMLNLNVRYIENDRLDLEGTSSGAMLRLLLKLN